MENRNERKPKIPKTNRIGFKGTEKTICNAAKTMSRTLIPCLGPYGSNTILQKGKLNHEITKDGFTILSNLFFLDEGERLVFDFIKKISQNQMLAVGDGTTSSIILASKLYEDLFNFKKELKIPGNIMEDVIDDIKKILTGKVKTHAKHIEEGEFDKLYDIALISSNYKKEIADIVIDTYKEIGFGGVAFPEQSLSKKTAISISEGYEINRPLAAKIYANEGETICRHKKGKNFVRVFVIKGRLELADLDLLGGLIFQREINMKAAKTSEPSPVVVVCSGMDEASRNFFSTNREKAGLPIVPVFVPYKGTQAVVEEYGDLMAVFGNRYIDKEAGDIIPKMEGFKEADEFLEKYMIDIDEIYINDSVTRFIGVKGNENALTARKTAIKAYLQHLSSIQDHVNRNDKINITKRRLLKLENKLAKIYIGGDTQEEITNKFFLLEDTILAVKAAMESGYVPGGNLIVPYLINKEVMGNKEIYKQFKDKYFFHLNTDEKVSKLFSTIINSYSFIFVKILNNFYGYFEKTDFAKLFDKVNECIAEGKIINLMKNEVMEDFEETSIINSAKTEIEIISSSCSILKLLLSSNQIILTPDAYYRKEIIEMQELKKKRGY